MNASNREVEGKGRRPSLLDEVLERRMLLYVLAVGATFAGASGATQAKVVFTPSNAVVGSGGEHTLQIDLNNDATVDIVLSFSTPFLESTLWASGVAPGAAVITQPGPYRQYAAALTAGAEISNNGDFGLRGVMVREYFSYQARGRNPGFGSSMGPFANVTNRYLGVRFLINGQVHFAWIGFRSCKNLTATLLGWAYETQPKTPILAGAGQGAVFPPSAELRPAGSENVPAVRAAEPTSLELLAAGHVAVADWRRRNAAVAAPVASPS